MSSTVIEVEPETDNEQQRQREKKAEWNRRYREKKKGTTKKEDIAVSALQKPLSRILGLASVVFAWYVTRPIKNEQVREHLQDAMEMTADEKRDISEPLANIFSRTSLAGRIGRYIVESDDYVTLGTALFTYGARVFEAMKNIGEMNVTRREAGPPAGANGHKPEIEFAPSANFNSLQNAA